MAHISTQVIYYDRASSHAGHIWILKNLNGLMRDIHLNKLQLIWNLLQGPKSTFIVYERR